MRYATDHSKAGVISHNEVKPKPKAEWIAQIKEEQRVLLHDAVMDCLQSISGGTDISTLHLVLDKADYEYRKREKTIARLEGNFQEKSRKIKLPTGKVSKTSVL